MSRTVLVTTALMACLAFMSIAAAAGDDSGQKIYLDPETGDALNAPPAQADDTGSARRSTTEPGAESSGPKAWTNSQGADMLTLDPDDAPATQAVHCADGSLRMGHTQSSNGRQSRRTLCEGKPE
ncbi:hypothetical protein [Salinisphaera aquimarina]|uniref:Secreted protein n=1 Tax=Salinisphaera aquimarina TaxID=2094031 RepID=A0ABV7EWH6_9GAMM